MRTSRDKAAKRPSLGILARPVPAQADTGHTHTMRLDDVRGFVFDVDGTLVHRSGSEVHPLPGAGEVLDAVRASGRPFALFTNGSHMPPAAFARELREAGLAVEDEQLVTPLCSVQTYLARRPDSSVLAFATDAARAYLQERGVWLVDGGNEHIDAVFVAHPKEIGFEQLELAARAVISGARLLTGSYVAAYAGANGPILSRGAMVTAAIAKASGKRPTIVGKPSLAAVAEVGKRLGLPTEDSPSSATTSSWTSLSAGWAARGRCSCARESVGRSTSAAFPSGAGPTSRSRASTSCSTGSDVSGEDPETAAESSRSPAAARRALARR